MKIVYLITVRCFIAVLLLSSAAAAVADLRVHDVVMSNVINTPLNGDDEPMALDLHLSAMGRDMLLQLQPSRLNKVAKLNGMGDQSLPYLYEGYIAGDPNSWARISIKDGQPNGYLFHYGKLLQLESRTHLNGPIDSPVEGSDLILIEPLTSTDAAPLLRSLNMAVDTEQYAPTYELSEDTSFHPQVDKREKLAHSLTTRNALGTTVTRAMRIGIVIDSRFNETHQNRGLARALSIINSVDAIYQSQLGIAIIVEGIRVYDDPATDPLRNSDGAVDQILSNFRPIRNTDERLPNDLTLVHLFSGHRDPNRVIGLGWISTACRLDGFDLSMSTPFPFDTLLAAHEIAHNLGALHDDNPQCDVDLNKQSNTLMWPELSGSSTAEFSQCSMRNMQAAKAASCNLDNIDVGVRLRTFPSSESLRRSVIIEVTNNDLLQRATSIVTKTDFPPGTQFTDISAGCNANGTVVICNHGAVKAQSTHSLSLSATLLNRSRENVQTEIELLNASDVDTDDNRAVIQLLQFDDSTGEALASASQSFSDNDLPLIETGNTTSGIGAASTGFIATLLFILCRSWHLALRRRRYKLRFTE